MVVSRWERGLHKPPADCLIQMGKLAGPPDGWYFWKMAGIDPAEAKRMLKYVLGAPRSGKKRDAAGPVDSTS